MVTADFGREIELMLFLRMRAKEIAISLGTSIPIEELFPYYRKLRSPERMARVRFLIGSFEMAVSAYAQLKLS